MAKHKTAEYKSGSFCEVSDIQFKLIICEYEIGILLTLQSHIFNWYHMYCLHP